MAEVAQHACWVLGGVGLIAAYSIYSYPMHVPFMFTAALAFVSVVLLFLSMVIYISRGYRPR